MTQWDTDLITRQWAASAISSSNARTRAAVGLVQAALLPDDAATPEQRRTWVRQALALAPTISGPLSALAWLLPGRECRKVLLDLGFDPRLADGGHALRFSHNPIRSDAPPLVVAIGQGNLAAVEQAMEVLDPTQPLAGGRAAVTDLDGDGSWHPETSPNWLGWSLLLGQWKLAERLWIHPGMRAQDSLDRALFETVRGMVGNQKLPSPEALSWIQRLVEAGANPHVPIPMTAGQRAKIQWFHGPIQGRPRESLEAVGWTFFQDQPYCGWPTAGRREAPSQGKHWTAVQLAWRQDSPLLRTFPPTRQRGGEIDAADLACHEALRKSMGTLMKEAAPRDWQGMLEQLMVATQAECFMSNASKPAISWPDWVVSGWQELPERALMQEDDTRPDCMWLDLISLYHSARLQPHLYADLAQSCARALETVSGRLAPAPAHVVPGLMRAMATCARPGEDGLDEAMATPGLRELIAQSTTVFQAELGQWADEYANEAQRWQAHRAICQNGASSKQWQEEQACAQTLDMLRGALVGLMRSKTAPRATRSRL